MTRHRYLAPDEVLAAVRQLGEIRLNRTTRMVEINGEVVSRDEISLLYLDLSTPTKGFRKRYTFDAVMLLARQNAYTPEVQP